MFHPFFAYKRVPIQKGCDLAPLPSSMRPINVFSIVMRAVARMLTASLIDWKRHVAHRGQRATHGGTAPALARVTSIIEKVRRRHGKRWCLTIDFSKLYNMIDPVLTAEAMTFMGLTHDSAISCYCLNETHPASLWPLETRIAG